MKRLALASRMLGSSLCVAALASAVMTCSDNLSPTRLVPATLARSSGDGQTGTVAQTLPNAVVVRVLSASGAPVQGVTVTWTVTTGGGSVTTATATTDASGLNSAVWTLGAIAGANAVAVSLAAYPTVGATSFAATGIPGPPAKLAYTVQPTAVTAGTAIAPAVQVTVQDVHGNTATSATNGVTFAITGGTGTAGAVLGGTVTQAAVAGVATFANLTVDKAAAGYTLTATASGLTSAVSTAFTVSAGAPAKLVFTEVEMKLLEHLVPAKDGATKKTVGRFLTLLVRLGGYLNRKRDAPPGNMVQWRGMARLTDIHLGFSLAKDVGN